MKVYQVRVDTIRITLIVDKEEDVIIQVIDNDNNFYREGNRLFCRFGNYIEECSIIDMTDERGIIQHESH